MTSYTPILLLASERSGTNLLRAILSSHSGLISPPPCGFMDVLAAYAYNYLPPYGKRHIEPFIDDLVTMTQIHLNPWDVELHRQAILDRIQGTSFWDLFRAINEIYVEQKRGAAWLSKEPDLFRHVYEMAFHYPDARFVYLVRDGRDVVASMLRQGVHERDLHKAAKRWRNDQQLCLRAASDSSIRERLFIVKYEELIQDPEAVTRQLMDFIGMSFEPAQLEFYREESVIKHAGKSEFWKNLSKPVDASNAGKYRQYLSDRDVGIFENLCWNEMKLLGYELNRVTRTKVGKFDRLLSLISHAMKRKSSKQLSEGEIAQRQKRARVIFEILNRRFD